MSKSFTVAEVAAILRVDQGKILEWLKTGELIGINVAKSTAKVRPRWRILAEDLEAFRNDRSSRPNPEPELANA